MKKRSHRKSAWLLTVASAYSGLPGCGDDSPNAPAYDAGLIHDAGPQNFDAGVMLSPPDSGSYDAGLRPDAGDAGPSIVFDAGLVVGPPDGGKDAGSDGSVDADVASPADAGGDPASVVGTVVLPPVAT